MDRVTPALSLKNAWAVGFLATLLLIGMALYQVPSLRAAVVASGQYAARDAEAILAARSPGDRPAGTFLTKVKKALGSVAMEDAGGTPATNPRLVTRSRLIPPHTSEVGPGQEEIPLDILSLLVPLDGLEETVDAPQLALFSVPAAFPNILIGDAGGLSGSSGRGQAGGGGLPIGEAPPVIAPDTPSTTGPTPEPSSPVPEPSTWLSMMVGLTLTAAALRRRRRFAALPV